MKDKKSLNFHLEIATGLWKYSYKYICLPSHHKLIKGHALDTAQMDDLVRKMIGEALISDCIEEIFELDKNLPKNNTGISRDEYMAKINKITLPNTRNKLLQRLLSQVIVEFKKIDTIKCVDFSKELIKLAEVYNERKRF